MFTTKEFFRITDPIELTLAGRDNYLFVNCRFFSSVIKIRWLGLRLRKPSAPEAEVLLRGRDFL